MVLLFISYLFGNIAIINKLNPYNIYIYSAFIFISVYAYSELMDRSLFAVIAETIKAVVGIVIIYKDGDWFGVSQYSVWINYVLIAYFIISFIITAWFVYQHYREDQSLKIAI